MNRLSPLSTITALTLAVAFKPSEPFLYAFVRCDRQIHKPAQTVFPFWTYGQLVLLPILSLASELLGYRAVVVIGVLGRLVTLLILLSATESLLLMQLSQVSIAAGFAAHPALVAIMYRVLPAEQYARAVGLVACSGVVSEVLSSLLGQLLHDEGVEYVWLFVISALSTCVALVLAGSLPSPPPSKAARALILGPRPPASAAALLPAPLPPIVRSIRSNGPPGSGEWGDAHVAEDELERAHEPSAAAAAMATAPEPLPSSAAKQQRLMDSVPLLLSDLATALRSDSVRWYLWIAIATAVHHLVVTYWQVMPGRGVCDTSFSPNGWVQAAASLLGGGAALLPLLVERTFGSRQCGWLRRLLLVCAPVAMGWLLLGLWRLDGAPYFACYVAFHVLFELMRVVCDAEGARCVARATYKGVPRFALVCGLATTTTMVLQTCLQLALVEESSKSGISHYFLSFAMVMFALFAGYAIHGAAIILSKFSCCRRRRRASNTSTLPVEQQPYCTLDGGRPVESACTSASERYARVQ